MTDTEKLDAIMAHLADLNDKILPKPVVEYSQDDIDRLRKEYIRMVVSLMETLAKGPGFPIEQIKALRAFNMPLNSMGTDDPYIGLKDAKDMVLAIHQAKKAEY